MKRLLMILMAVTTTAFTGQQQKEHILFFGDSITEAGVNKGGYITVMADQLQARGLASRYTLTGAGISGNKIYDLFLRIDNDVIARKPNTVVIWVGVNDVWHKKTFGTGTDPDKFEKFYTAVIQKLKAQNIKVFLCTPAAIGEKTDFSNPLDGDLNHYANIIRSIARNQQCGLIDLRKAFLDYNLANNLKNEDKNILTTDGVHLNPKGNEFVALEMIKALIP